MIAEVEVEGVGTLRHLNSWQIQRLRSIRGDNRFIAPIALGLGMTIPQFKKLAPDLQRAAADAYGRLMSPSACGLAPVRQAPSVPAKGSHVAADKKVFLGRRLMEVRAKLPRGHFRKWVEETSGLSWSQANNYMKAAREFGDDNSEGVKA